MGLDADQLDLLVERVHRMLVEDPDPPVAPGRMWALGLYKSVVLVLFLLRQNPVQAAAAELFGVSQATVSRRWTVLLPVVEKVLARHVPDPGETSAGRVVLIDGTLIPTWDRAVLSRYRRCGHLRAGEDRCLLLLRRWWVCR
ncbi:transposase family protein [Streptomyces cinereoruber]|uniref:transposase family protein n=1 Tax=Streptomyces cinereoruber TaxID=67260 RepID=UPI00364F8BAF